MNPERRLNGRVALITGASRGIGREMAKVFAANGAHVLLAARTLRDDDGDGIETAAAEIETAGGLASTFVVNLNKSEERDHLVGRALDQVGHVDILVNNAAVTYFQPVESFPLKRYDLMFEVQVRAPFHLSQLVLPGMRARRTGWILNVSSIASRHPHVPHQDWTDELNSSVYGMCKAALERFSTGLAAEVWDDDISVNALSPSRVVPTPGTIHHGLTSGVGDPAAEPIERFVAAALELCSAPPRSRTGLVVCTDDVLGAISAS